MVSEEFLNIFRRIVAILCCIFGLPGNILTIIVCIKALYIRTNHFQRKVFHLYLVEISILDTCLLLYWIIETLLNYLHEIKRIEFLSLMHISPFSCYFYYMFNRICAALCSWLLTCFTFIRFINIFHQFNTIKSNIILLTSLIIIFSLANSYSFLVLEYNPEQKFNKTQKNNATSIDYTTICSIRSEYANDNLTLLMNILIAGVLSLAIPSILILIVNVTIVCFIRRIYSTQADDKVKRRSDITNYHSTRSTLLVISMTYVLFYIPYLIFNFLMIVSEDPNGIVHYWAEITSIFRHVSHSVNFYAYLFTSLTFRQESLFFLRYLFRPCIYFKKRQQFKQRIKRSQLIIIDKSPLPLPPVPLHSSLNGKSPQQVYIRRVDQINYNQDEQNLIGRNNETWM
ncbi:unnamed protein product [Adineta steineri]|uniref:G-protein coupled receptors family 1 profile domain-containing protein n=1 Tax=Adineta steineri TaxID=433720 RepID=A0A815HRZ9_9BILA|nr:unnamed protein product [Adineta steineri]CAF1354297.1 unnamed protein product [Adineta steineri]